MQLFAGTSVDFIEAAVQNQIAGRLRESFFQHYRFYPADSEVRSWNNSLNRIKDVFQRANLLDHGVVLEYQLPLTSKRLDCMITGRDKDRHDNAVIIELKQWDSCEAADGENEVVTWTGNGNREVLHPSVQVNQYEMYLRDAHTAFHAGVSPIQLHSCGYLHNYTFQARDILLIPKFRAVLQRSPLFSADDVDKLCGYLDEYVCGGQGMPILSKVQESVYRPSKKLLEHVHQSIKEKPEYVLVDEQLVAYDAVLAAVKRGLVGSKRTAILIRGGPGTGKSVIAINLIAELSRLGFNAQYATGSKSFTTTLRKIMGVRGAVQFKYFNSYSDAQPDQVDALICDESHRIRQTSVSRYTPKTKRSGKSQLAELLDVAKVPVFFIDDLQVVRPGETGSTQIIRDEVRRRGHDLREYELEAQFRCSGSDAFVNWIDNTLEVRRTANSIWEPDERFEFKVYDSPESLENAVREKVAGNNTGRVMAGFGWKWSLPDAEGVPPDDVVIGEYRRPWNVRDDAERVAKGIPRASLWAYHPNGINQIGCVYTAQGFEFDYAGVIFGPDLRYDPDHGQWIGDSSASSDTIVKRAGDDFLSCVKNTYRVLLSRGMKGCYVYFMDRNTRNFFLSRTHGDVLASATTQPIKSGRELVQSVELKIIPSVLPAEQYVNYLPVVSLAAAAGGFGDEQAVRPLGWVLVSGRKITKGMFVARVKGHSMEPLIGDGSWCIFRASPTGSREGKVVLVSCRDIADPESSGRFTIKRYASEKEYFDDGTWRHRKITLKPENKEYKPIILENIEAESFRVVAEWLGVLV
jgi:SOS-response transcriptional repressor LexA